MYEYIYIGLKVLIEIWNAYNIVWKLELQT